MSTRRKSSFWIFAAASIIAIECFAQVAPAADGTVASDPIFNALTVDGATLSGRIREFGPSGGVTLVPADGPERVIPREKLVKLIRDSFEAPLAPEASVVLFPGGDRLHSTAIVKASETSLEVQSYMLGLLSVPLESLLGLVFVVPPNPEALGLGTGSDALESLIGRVRNEPRATEVVWLNNGDKQTGGFLSLTEKTITIQPAKDPISLERTGVVALGFDPSLVVYPKPEQGGFELTFREGSRLGVTDARVEQGQVLAKTRFGASIRVPISDLTRIHARNDSIVYLTEREPGGERYIPYVGPPRAYRRDASVEGHALRLSGQDFDRGIGTQSRTLLAYRIEPGDRRFQAQVGVDDRAGPLGSVVFRVLVDSTERAVTPTLSARDAPRSIDVDVSGGKLLILITEFGERGGVRDLADWVEARIIR